MDSLYQAVYLVGNLFNTYILYRFIDAFFDQKRTGMKVQTLMFILYFVTTAYLYIGFSNPYMNVVANIFLLFLWSFNYESHLGKRIVSIFMIYGIMAAIEMTVIFIIPYWRESLIADEEYVSIGGTIIIKVLSYGVAVLVSKRSRLKESGELSLIYSLGIFIISLATTTLIFLLFLTIKETSLYTVSLFFLLLTVNFMSIFLYEKLIISMALRIEKKIWKEQALSYARQLEIMEESQRNMRAIKHDLKNHFAIIGLMLKEKQVEKAEAYIADTIDIIVGKGEVCKSGNEIIDSIVNFKLNPMVTEDIRVEVKANVPNEIAISQFDIIGMIGNLLDNAIEGVQKVSLDRYISLDIYYEKGVVLIKIKNSYDGDIHRWGEKFITTKEDAINHGVGIDAIKRIVSNYDGNIDIDTKNNCFHIEIVLYEK